MLPLGFTDLADAPTIVLSPHQHQFDPISSRAAHSYTLQPVKPIMPVRPWDLSMSSASGRTNPHTKKRSRAHLDREERLEAPPSLPTSHANLDANIPQKAAANPLIGISSAGQMAVESKRPGEEEKEDPFGQNAQGGDSHSSKRQRQDPLIDDNVRDQAHSIGPSIVPVEADFAQLIGVGWTAIGSDPDTISAWRGIAKGIEERTGITGATVVAKNRNVDACLVSAREGYYLVRTGADRGVFIGQAPEEAFQKIPSMLSQLSEDCDADTEGTSLILRAIIDLSDDSPDRKAVPSGVQNGLQMAPQDTSSPAMSNALSDTPDDSANSMDLD